MLGVTYKSAWFMTMRLREAMTDPKAGPIGSEGKDIESEERSLVVARRTSTRASRSLASMQSMLLLSATARCAPSTCRCNGEEAA
jgi:hypothetical protein